MILVVRRMDFVNQLYLDGPEVVLVLPYGKEHPASD